jgi:hypothetical protein
MYARQLVGVRVPHYETASHVVNDPKKNRLAPEFPFFNS